MGNDFNQINIKDLSTRKNSHFTNAGIEFGNEKRVLLAERKSFSKEMKISMCPGSTEEIFYFQLKSLIFF